MIAMGSPCLTLRKMNNSDQVAQNFLQAYYQAFVLNRPGLAAYYVSNIGFNAIIYLFCIF